jgi:hypothetical protein
MQMMSSRGLLEELRVGIEVAVGRGFNAARRTLHRLLWLDGGAADSDSPADLLERRMRRRATPPPMPPLVEEGVEEQQQGEGQEQGKAAAGAGAARAPRRSGGRPPLRSLLRSGRHWEEDLSVWTASDVILREGYPLEQHSVTTSGERTLSWQRWHLLVRSGPLQLQCCLCLLMLQPRRRPLTRPWPFLAASLLPADGYVLQMHRIPRHGARDAVIFQHGMLDTSLGWVRLRLPLHLLASKPSM